MKIVFLAIAVLTAAFVYTSVS
jgi:C1A family cysteine protease